MKPDPKEPGLADDATPDDADVVPEESGPDDDGTAETHEGEPE